MHSSFPRPFSSADSARISRPLRLCAATATAVGVFCIDTFTPLSSAVAVLYVFVLPLVGEAFGARRLWLAAAACAGLATLSFVLSHGLEPDFAALLRLLVSLAAITIGAVLVRSNAVGREAMRESEARYRNIFNTLAIAIWEHDMRPVQAVLATLRARGVRDIGAYLLENPDFVAQARAMTPITDVNARGLQLMGFEHKGEFFSTLDDMLLEDDAAFAQFLVAIYEGRSRFEAESTVRTRAGELIPIVVGVTFPQESGNWSRVQASVFDLSDQRRMQERLAHTRAELEHALRAASLGALSASIAHEVNQPVAAASNYAGAARRWLAQTPPDIAEAQQALGDVTVSLERAAEVVKGVRALIGRTPTERTHLALDELVTAAARQISHVLTEHQASLILDLQAPDAVLLGDRVLLQQVMINLMVNAAQAMGNAETEVRRLTVRTRRSGDDVIIEILDTGPGFTPLAAEQGFQAFFSTKPGGMGLGLAICRSTILAHDGAISLRPAPPEGGGRVSVRLPLGPERQAP